MKMTAEKSFNRNAFDGLEFVETLTAKKAGKLFLSFLFFFELEKKN